MKYLILLVLFMFTQSSFGQPDDELRKVNFPKSEKLLKEIPVKNKVWVFIMAGQSNMAGRGFVEPADTISHNRILSINADGEMVYAQEPLHWYEPNLTGLDCGMSFAQSLIKKIPEDISILLLPVAIGGSSTSQWLGDSTYRNVPLFTNFKEKAALASFYGQVKGILWHQGESDANALDMPGYPNRIKTLFKNFRFVLGDDKLPIIMGELGSYSKTNDNWQQINIEIHKLAKSDVYSHVINTQDLVHKGDFIHFNSESQREMGRRFGEAYLSLIKP